MKDRALIDPENHFALVAILLAIAWFGCWAERHPELGKIPGVVYILVVGLLLSNTGIIPMNASLYGVVGGYIMPLAIPLLLFKATIKKVVAESGMILPIFLLGSVTVTLGALLGYFIFDLGPQGAKVMAAYTASWIGGMVNMVALSEVTQMTASEFSTAVSASAPVSLIGLGILVSLPSIPLVRRLFPSRIMDAQQGTDDTHSDPGALPQLRVTHIAAALAISAALCEAGKSIAAILDINNYSLFIITVLTVLLANLAAKPMQAIEGDFELGMYLMYVFFAMIGASTDALGFVTQAPVFFAFGITIIVVHIALLLLFAKLFKFDLAETIIGSGANIVGAAAAAGIASSKGWRTLVTPAIATSMLGYAVANFFGIALFELFQ